jgi:hypothetical protein
VALFKRPFLIGEIMDAEDLVSKRESGRTAFVSVVLSSCFVLHSSVLYLKVNNNHQLNPQ